MTNSVPSLRARKRRHGAAPIVMVTAYDEPTARYADAGGVDVLLVGDSLANVVLGHEDTLHVTTAEMAHHVRAVAAASPRRTSWLTCRGSVITSALTPQLRTPVS